MSYLDKAKEYKSYGLNPVPVRAGTKEPIRSGHSNTRITDGEILKYDWEWIGVSTGSVSQGLEVLDFDLKNAENPESILKGFKSKVSHKLLSKLVTQQTQSGGYHIIYRCEALEGSRKLAKNADGEAIIETRGEGGFIVCAPTEGYELKQGSFDKIPIITPEERLELFVSARMLNEQVQKDAKRRRGKVSEWHDKFPKYDTDPKIGLDLLKKHGWTFHSEDEKWVNLTRPGKDQGISAGYHKEGMFLYVFSSSTQFETEMPYNNHDIYAELECRGKYNVAYAKLYEAGYGAPDIDEEKIEEFNWQESLDKMTFISNDEEEDDYLEQARKGEIEMGLTTGWQALDEYYRLKTHSVDMGIAYDGVGKSLFMDSLAVASKVVHGMKWGMVVPENKTAMTRRRLIEAETGKQIDFFKDHEDMFQHYKEESYKHFKIVTNSKHFSVKEVLEMGARMYDEYGIDYLLIDPYNFFRVDSRNGYSWNNEILSQLRVFAEKYCSVMVMAHPSSNAPRTNKDEEGFLKAPSAYDIQGGADFPYRVDDFFVLHRVKNHPDPTIRRTMQVIMTKVKEEETGGKVHSKGEYTEMVWETHDGFLGYWDEYGNNPMFDKLYPKGGRSGGLGVNGLPQLTPIEAFGEETDDELPF